LVICKSLYYDARSEKHKKTLNFCSTRRPSAKLKFVYITNTAVCSEGTIYKNN